MQVESFVDKYGICNESNLDGEMACLKVEYECLRAVHDGIDVCNWMESYDKERNDGTHALVDLAPNIIRDICAGLCVWTSIRGKKLVDGPDISHPYLVRAKTLAGVDDAKRQVLREYLATTEVFRNSAMRATSHEDTQVTLERINRFWQPFADSVMEMDAAS
jgi:hypothetical protein